MARDTVQLVYFFALLLFVAILAVIVFLPYLPAILFAIVLAIVFSPVHRDLEKALGNRRFLAAFISTTFVLVAIMIPAGLFGVVLVQEILRLYGDISSSSFHLVGFLEGGIEMVRTVAPSVAGYLSDQLAAFNFNEYIQQLLSWALQATNALFTQTLHLILAGALSVLALFYLFKDGDRAVQFLVRVSPLARGYERMILQKIEDAINSVIRGRVLAGLVQGILTGLAFTAVGIPAPVLWGACAAILSVIPLLGPGIVITPAIIYLLVIGNVWGAAILFVWAMIAIYFVDDILGPILIERGMNIHPFLILISILGGISFLGPVGFIGGPVILALLFALLDLYPTVLSGETQDETV